MKPLKFSTAFNYPFVRAKGMFNIFWLLLPIIGLFALGGYSIRIVKEFSKGKFKKLPVFKFKKYLKLGFFMFLKAIPFIIVYLIVVGVLSYIPILGGLSRFILDLFIVPILFIHFLNKETVGSFFEFSKIKYVCSNFGDYVIVLLKSLLLSIIFLIMIVILVGIPAGTFTKNIFIADFYRRRVR